MTVRAAMSTDAAVLFGLRRERETVCAARTRSQILSLRSMGARREDMAEEVLGLGKKGGKNVRQMSEE